MTTTDSLSFSANVNGTLLPADLGMKYRELRKVMGEIRMEITPDEHHRRIRYALSLGLESAAHLADKASGERIIVVGSGPSLKDSLPHLKATRAKIIACNASHDFLLANGIKPWAGIMLDTHEWCETYQTPTEGVAYFIGTSVHPKVWQRFRSAGMKPWVFVPIILDNDHERLFPMYGNDLCLVAGATTVGLRAFNFATMLGAAAVEIHGFDSCYAPGHDGKKGSNQLHAHAKPFVHHAVKPVTVTSKATGHTFKCLTNDAMAKQVLGYASLVESLPVHQGTAEAIGSLPMAEDKRIGKCRMIVAGDGIIPWMAWKDGGPDKYVEHLNPERMQAKYGDAPHWDYFADKPYELESAA